MDKGVYEFFIFEEKNLVYYCDQHAFDVKVDYDQLKQDHRIQNMYSFSEKFSSTVKELHPSSLTVAKNFKTKEYQYSLLQTTNGTKFILITSVRADNSPELSLNLLFESYINYVKKNYMHQPGERISGGRFEEQVKKILRGLQIS